MFIQVLVGNPGGKRPHGMPVCGWKDNIKMELKENKARIL
jgi:hypothetical protein